SFMTVGRDRPTVGGHARSVPQSAWRGSLPPGSWLHPSIRFSGNEPGPAGRRMKNVPGRMALAGSARQAAGA
ncbi:MAG TPA: hypothetical protein VJ761_14600, partial [Ktedonobacteraceae bacterium]|nr:hypothetical protein [Ktedonobacteraceae bacterium]